jgi:phenylalanyl-tRNA synthetase alpha chain
MLDAIAAARDAALAALAAAPDHAALDAWKSTNLGKSGPLADLMGRLKEVPKDQKPAVGAALNAARAALEQALADRKASLGDKPSTDELIDVTEPGLVVSSALGRSHIITRVTAELAEVFARMGFEVADGPEVEDDEHNFVKLNIPPNHPARDPADNFYVDNPVTTPRPRMLRSQTSTVQIRVMEAAVAAGGGTLRTPIKIVAPGRVYRPDTVDATHSFMFHQIEGLCIDRAASMVELKSTLFQFVRAYFGNDAEIRFTPTFYPFTEPSAQFEINVRLTPDAPQRWIELGGCGMVHPNVLESCGINPDEWSGFAFGFGIERLAMGKYRIPDIRMLFENDLRFLQQL